MASMFVVETRRPLVWALALLVCAVAWLGMAQAAQAGQITRVGTTYRYIDGADDTTSSSVVLYYCQFAGGCGGNEPADSYILWDNAENPTQTGTACFVWVPNGGAPRPDLLACPSNGTTRWELALTGGDDIFEPVEYSGVWPVNASLSVDGGSGHDTLTGSPYDDTLVGGPGDDILSGGNGNDTLAGGLGDDTLRGGDGDDILTGNENSDLIDGQGGTDDRAAYVGRTTLVTVTLGAGGGRNDGGTPDAGVATPTDRDEITNTTEGVIGGSVNDSLSAAAAAFQARLEGGPGDDTLTGGPQDDTFVGGDGADIMNGGGGSGNTVSYADKSAGVTVSLGAKGGNAGDGSGDNLTLIQDVIGSPHNDVITGSGVANHLRGEGGDDVLRGLGGPDTMNGGAGRDTATYSERTASEPVTLSLDAEANDGAESPPEKDDIRPDVEVIVGGAGADTLSATPVGVTSAAGGVELRGGGGDDRLTAPAGGASLFGEDGNDQMTGGAAGDHLDGGSGNDNLNGLGGADTILGGSGADAVEARDGVVDNIDCGSEVDTAQTDANDNKANCDEVGPPPPPPPPPPPATPRIVASVTFGFEATRRFTVLTDLIVKNIPRGSKVVAVCKTKAGKACKGKLKKRFTKNRSGLTQRLKFFERKRIPLGARIEIRVTKAGSIGSVKRVTMRARKVPSVATQCLPLGSTRPRTSCA
jgi:Ca2+-binding RTX toxin-like protein